MREIHEVFANDCGVCSCTKVELLGLRRALAIVWNGGRRKVQVVVDSVTVVRMLVELIPAHSPYIHIITKFRALIQRQEWVVNIS